MNATLTPLRIGSMELANRIVMAPMGTNLASPDGSVTERLMSYYERRARGGTGLVIVENTSVSGLRGSNGTTNLFLDHDRYVPGLWELTERLHRHGARAALQLNHAGAATRPERTGSAPVSSSNLPLFTGASPPLPLDHLAINAVVADFAESARRAQQAGFDAVEIHAGHTYLLAQFLSPRWNNRTDLYGGDIVGRTLIVREVLAAVRVAVGPRFPIIIRVSTDEPNTGGLGPQELLDSVAEFVDAVDILDISGAPGGSLTWVDHGEAPYGTPFSLARLFRERFGKVTIAGCSVRSSGSVESILSGGADLVALGRGLIADPDWVNKVAAGQSDTILQCISCNIGCVDHRVRLNRPIRCSINPDIFGNLPRPGRLVTRPTRVVVVGGGIAGLEAAATAAEVGCTVTLFESRKQLGGIFGQAVKLPAKQSMATFVDHLIGRATRSGVTLLTGSPATTQLVADLAPQLVVNATGAHPLIPPIPGLRERVGLTGTGVQTIVDLLSSPAQLEDLTGQEVVVVGAGAVGLDVVEACVNAGANVALIERLSEVGSDLDVVARARVGRMLASSSVRVMLETSLSEVGDGWVRVSRPDGKVDRLESSNIFICMGMSPTCELHEELLCHFSGMPVDVVNIGDSAGVGKVIDATRTGHGILNVLIQKGYLGECIRREW